MWPSEEIPDEDRLFMRVHKNFLLGAEDDYIPPGVFRDQGPAMSTDWEKYSSPEQSRERARKPEVNGVIALVAGPVRTDAGQEVVHTPDEPRGNRAHTDVRGKKDGDPRVRLALQRCARWEIKVPK